MSKIETKEEREEAIEGLCDALRSYILPESNKVIDITWKRPTVVDVEQSVAKGFTCSKAGPDVYLDVHVRVKPAVPAAPPKTYKVGDRFIKEGTIGCYEGTYQIMGACKASPNGPCFLANLMYGWAYTGKAIQVENCHNITEKEFKEMTDGREFIPIARSEKDGDCEICGASEEDLS